MQARYCICYFILWHLIGWVYILAILEKVVYLDETEE